MHKTVIKILIFLFLAQCGYSTVYKSTHDDDIRITINKFEGDKEFNNRLNIALRKYFNTNTQNKFEIDIYSEFSKNTISKNTKGKASNFRLEAITTFKVNYKEKNYTLVFNEFLKVKNLEDSFEQKKYEAIVKRNFAESMQEKLILKLKTL